MPDDMNLGDRLRRENIHMAWLNSGGIQGHSPTAHAPSMLELFGVPYVGHDPLAAATLDNKHAFKRGVLCAGLPTAAFVTWHMARGVFRPDINSRFQRAFGDYPGPFVVKPVSGRASLHVHVVQHVSDLPDAVAEVHRATQNLVLIEQFLGGREYCIAVAGPVTSRNRSLVRGQQPFTVAPLERVLGGEEKIFTSMDVQPITAERCRQLDSPGDAGVLERMRRIACEVYYEFSLGSLVRLDLRANEAGDLFILEANPKPDLKYPGKNVTSLIAAGLPAAGMDYDDLILSLIADRLDFLLTHRQENVEHIVELLKPSAFAGADLATADARALQDTIAKAYREAAGVLAAAEQKRVAIDALVADAATREAGHDVIRRIHKAATDASVEALETLVTQPQRQRRVGS
jgi:D-alanine-D-alanine ligase